MDVFSRTLYFAIGIPTNSEYQSRMPSLSPVIHTELLRFRKIVLQGERKHWALATSRSEVYFSSFILHNMSYTLLHCHDEYKLRSIKNKFRS